MYADVLSSSKNRKCIWVRLTDKKLFSCLMFFLKNFYTLMEKYLIWLPKSLWYLLNLLQQSSKNNMLWLSTLYACSSMDFSMFMIRELWRSNIGLEEKSFKISGNEWMFHRYYEKSYTILYSLINCNVYAILHYYYSVFIILCLLYILFLQFMILILAGTIMYMRYTLLQIIVKY